MTKIIRKILPSEASLITKSVRNNLLAPVVILLTLILCGWGSTGHKIINKNSVLSFPTQMKDFLSWADPLYLHASDADNRKNADPTESPKHFIDIDNYPEFVATGAISQDYDSVVAAHGSLFVTSGGILPWAIVATYDSLQKCFERKDWNNAVLVTADLGHYVADSHQPLHITKNYNPGGLHSRYETDMLKKYQSQIIYSGDSVQFITNIPDFVFSTIYNNYQYVDSVLADDIQAKAVSSDTKSDAYYQKLWELTGSFTTNLFKNASNKLASLIYTAWVNAGSPPMPVASSVSSSTVGQITFQLEQNYPNPFNPETVIGYQLPVAENVSLKVYDMLGRETATLINEYQGAGVHHSQFSIINSQLSSGVYFYRLTAGAYSSTKKMIVLK